MRVHTDSCSQLWQKVLAFPGLSNQGTAGAGKCSRSQAQLSDVEVLMAFEGYLKLCKAQRWDRIQVFLGLSQPSGFLNQDVEYDLNASLQALLSLLAFQRSIAADAAPKTVCLQLRHIIRNARKDRPFLPCIMRLAKGKQQDPWEI